VQVRSQADQHPGAGAVVTDGGGGVHGAGQDRRLLVAWQVRSQGAMNCSGLSAVKKALTPAPIAYAPDTKTGSPGARGSEP